MPNSELGLADINVRLRSLCRRVNTFTALHAGAVCLAVILVSLALRFALGAQRFGIVPFGFCLAACLGTLGWAAMFARRRWLHPAEAAGLADRQAALDERLTTLLALGQSSTESRLLPLLLTQTIELGGRWQADRLVPRAYPRSIYVAAAALLALLASPLLEPALPPVAMLATDLSAAEPSEGEREEKGRGDPLRIAALTGGVDPRSAALSPGDGDPAAHNDKGAAEAMDSGPIPAQVSGSKPGAGAKAAAQVQAPPQSLRGTKVDTGKTAPAGGSEHAGEASNENTQGDGKPHGDETRGDRSRSDESNERRGDARDRGAQKGAAAEKDGKPAEIPPDPRSAAGQRAAAETPGNKPDASKDGAPPQDSHGGGSPNASGGSEMLTLGNQADPDGPAAGSFRLTLSSFLDEIEQRDPAPDQTPAPQRGAGPERPPPSLAERSTHDDVVHQTSIPPAYEEIVKRIYSRSQRP